MGRFFTRERFGRPQVMAGILLLIFLGQCVWLVEKGVRTHELSPLEFARIQEGLRLWGKKDLPWPGYPPPHDAEAGGEAQWFKQFSATPEERHYDSNHSPMWYLLASLPAWRGSLRPETIRDLHWLAATPFLLCGVLLGASLWYVSRRLYGNAGGYVALGLFCFSPGLIRASAIWFAEPEMGAAWGAFGAIFTAIAVAHTLYAPREVVLWNWRRIVLLGLSLALAIGSQFSLVILVPVALGFMLYLAPTRRAAVIAIWAAACAICTLIIFAAYSFHGAEFWKGLRQASFFQIAWPAFAMRGAYQQVCMQLTQSCPALALALPVAVCVYALWPRARYFGNSAPLFVAGLTLLLALGMPHYPGLGFQLIAVPFLLVFVAGVAADLLETRRRNLVLACTWGLLLASALWSLWQLARIGRS